MTSAARRRRRSPRCCVKYAIREGEFTLNSGRTSKWYLDGRQVSFRGDCLAIVGDAIVDALAVAGISAE